MNVVFNGQLIDEDELRFSDLYRVVFFADGLFESIYADNFWIYLVSEHLERLKRGANVIGLDFPESLNESNLINWVRLITQAPESYNIHRIKILLWRSGKGTYIPDKGYVSNFLILAERSEPFKIEEIHEYRVSENNHLSDSPISIFKTTNALSYVNAAIEKSNHGHELILKDHRGYIAEGVSSNLIMLNSKEKSTLVPSGSAHVQGTMQNFLIKHIQGLLPDFSIIKSSTILPKDLDKMDQIFFNNSFFIKHLCPKDKVIVDLGNPDDFLEFVPRLPLQL